MTITARVQNHTITLPAEMKIQDGMEVQVTLPDQPARETPASFSDSIRDLIGAAEGLPEDFAAEHDHYVHGTKKRAFGKRRSVTDSPSENFPASIP